MEVKRWNPNTEDFYDEMNPEEVERFAAGVFRFEFDRYLGAYPVQSDNYEKWKRLSYYITPSVLSQLEPIGKKISSLYDKPDDDIIAAMKRVQMEEVDNSNSNSTSTSNSNSANSLSLATHRPYYSDVSKLAQKKLMKGMSGQMITKLSMDKSPLLFDIIKRYGGMYLRIEIEDHSIYLLYLS